MKAYDIERYISGELEGEELRQFELLLSSDPALQEEVNKSRILLNQLKQLGISEKIKKAQHNNKVVTRWRIILLCCILSLGVLFFFYYFYKDSQLNKIVPSIESQEVLDPESEKQITIPDSLSKEKVFPPELPTEKEKIQVVEPPIAKNKESKEELNYEEIAMNYYSTPEEFAYLRGAHSISSMDSARMEFNNENYIETLNLLITMKDSDLQRDYFKAHVFFRLHQYDKANALFEKTISSIISKEKNQDIEWYILLNNLSCGIPCLEKTRAALKKILDNPNHNYFLQSKDMTERLRLSKDKVQQLVK